MLSLKSNPLLLSILGVVAVAGIGIATQIRKAVDGFDFFFKGISIKSASLNTIDFVFRIELVNASNLTIPISNFTGSYYIKNRKSGWTYLGKVSNALNISLKPGKSTYDIPFSFSTFSFPYQEIVDMTTGAPLEYKMDYTFYVKSIRISDKAQDKMSIPAPLIAVINILKSNTTVSGLAGLGCGCSQLTTI